MHVTCRQSDEPVGILFLDERNRIIDELDQEQLKAVCKGEQLELQIPQGTAYLLAEWESGDGSVTRTVCNRGGKLFLYAVNRHRVFIRDKTCFDLGIKNLSIKNK